MIDYDILWPKREHKSWRAPRQVFPNVNRVIQGVGLPVTRPGMIQLPFICHLTWAAGSLVELRRVITSAEVDVVVGLSLTNSLPMALYLKAKGIPYISVVLEPYNNMVDQRWARKPARICEALSYRKADRVVVFTPQMRQYVSGMGATPDQTVLLKTGVNLDVFHPDIDGCPQRKALGIAPDEWVLFFMGWLYDFSGLRQIFQAIAKEPNILDGARLLVVGDGDIYHELQSLIEQHHLSTRILMTGQRPYSEIPALLAAADVCLMPSLENDITRDIVPMKVYEYLAVQRPLVATCLPGMLSEFGQESGILYTHDPVEALARAIDLAKNPREVAARAEAGYKFVQQHANWECTTDKFEEILLSLTSVRRICSV